MSDNDNGTKKNDLGVPVIQIFINEQKQLTWNWHGVTGEQVEQILLNAFHGQVRYNLEQKNKQTKIIKPSLGETLSLNKGN